MVGKFGPGRRARRRAWVGAAVAASALLAMSGSAAAEWLPPHDLSPEGNSYSPKLVTGPDGVVHAFWDRDGLYTGGIETSDHIPGEGWSEPVRLSANGSETYPVLPGIDAAGNLSAFWGESNGGLLTLQSVTRPNGGQWTAPALVTGPFAAGGMSDTTVAQGRDGTAIALWTEPVSGSPAAPLHSSVRSPGGDWSAPTVISDPTRRGNSPMAVMDREGNATAIWYQTPGSNDLFTSSRPAGGTWSQPERLSIKDWVGAYVLTVADDGTLLAAWRAREPSLRNTIAVGIRRPGGSWTVYEGIDGGTALGHNADSPAVAIGPDGEMTVTWTRQMTGDWYRIQTSTRPAGSDAWSAPETLSADGRNAFEARVAYSPDGTVHAAWRRRNDVNYIVQAVERAPDGSWSEPANLSAASTANLELSGISFAFDADGDPVVSWYRSDGVVGRRMQTTTDDTHGPRLDEVTVPESATTGERLSFSVAQPVDTWSEVAETTWSFGDSDRAPEPGITAEHTFAAAGSYEVTVTSTDTLGNRSEETRTVTVTAPSRREDPPVIDPPVITPPSVMPPVVTPPAVVPPRPAPPAAGKPSARAFAGCRVPKLTGLTLPAARRRLRAAHCRLGKVRSVATTRRGPARIVRASRRAGARLRRGAKVDVTLARRSGRRK
ncbi:PKD domain-containing protein [Conexibacter stalactiti]|uniref:PKD domain-containing protein n=1 Tax=Conexibacter stalactiti TaxID=1940611 RepID=A0ABU4HSG9_9ACTN|nr:PKD domain-containing protein [Conexibacter stalactiti]MDW5596256.1 PKD domain-containing protein [Conexibacter stalactiti]MEC5036898.1 PKD domain-containing protein [Conexibacter stalactiti]